MDGDWMPLPTRPQRYYDPASLVYSRIHNSNTLFVHPSVGWFVSLSVIYHIYLQTE